GGGSARGNSDFDVSILKIDLSVPPSANCLTFDFRFLSEEYPGYVNSTFNDAFVAELDSSTWKTSGSTISAPDNFAFDSSHNVISVNSTGIGGMSAANGIGTAFNGATTYGANGFPNPPNGNGPARAGRASVLPPPARAVPPGAPPLSLSLSARGALLPAPGVSLDTLVVGFAPARPASGFSGAPPVDPPITAIGKAVSATEGVTFD